MTDDAGSTIASPEIVAHLLSGDDEIPNNERCPLLAYRGAVRLPGGDPAAVFEGLFHGNRWTGSWRNGIFPFHHFHSTAHEVLGIYSGRATVQLGGESGVVLDVEPGDVVIVPAGVGHKKLASSGDLGVVGAYADGRHADMCRPSSRSCRQRWEQVSRIPLPAMDPVFGGDGPLFQHWRG
jgi:uncharacterized protein YjlB